VLDDADFRQVLLDFYLRKFYPYPLVDVHQVRLRRRSVAADVQGQRIEGTFGILCEANGDDHEGYVLIDPDSGTYEVRKLTGGSAFSLADGRFGAIQSGSTANSLEGYCDHSVAGAPTVLTFFVNGVQVIQIQDSTFSSFTGIGRYVESGSGGTDARFDNLVMSA